MGDFENAQQSSKKRAALKELSRENHGLEDKEEEKSCAMESSSFKIASKEVLASRRIIRVKRRVPSKPAPAPASNPFAGIRLVPSTVPAPVTTAVVTNKPLPESNSTRSDATIETDADKNEAIDTVGTQEIHDDGTSDTSKEVYVKAIDFVDKDSGEAKNGLSTFALKFKDPTLVQEFRAVIEEHKQPKTTVVVEAAAPPLMTPENSPES